MAVILSIALNLSMVVILSIIVILSIALNLSMAVILSIESS